MRQSSGSFQAVHAFDAVRARANNNDQDGGESREEAERLAVECKASGLSQGEFCEQRGLH
jgi:hypothetical protein